MGGVRACAWFPMKQAPVSRPGDVPSIRLDRNPMMSACKRNGASALTALLLIGAGCSSGPEVGSDTAAIVNEAEIKISEVDKRFDAQLRQSPRAPSPEEASTFKLNILSQLINDELLMQLAAADNLTASDAEVSTRFTDFKKNYTEEKFQEFLKEQGFTEEEFRQTLRKSATIEKLYNKEITSKISVTEAEIEQHFEENKADYNLPKGWRLAHILITDAKESGINNTRGDDATTPAEAEKKAQLLMRRLLNGEDFARLAAEYSEDAESAPRGGDLGFVTEQQMETVSPELKKTVQNLKVEQVFPRPIRIGYGYHLVKLLAKERGGQHELSEPQVQANIRQTIFNRKENLLKTAYLEVIRNDAQIRNVLAEKLLDSR